MNIQLSILMMIIFLSSLSSSKVKERFRYEEIGGELRVTLPYVAEEDLPNTKKMIFIDEIMRYLGKKFNASLLTSQYTSHGHCNHTTGEYEPGLKYLLQKNLTDFIFNPFRMDGHECEGVVVGPALLDSGYIIISFTNRTKIATEMNILGFLTNFDAKGYYYLGIIILMVIISCIICCWIKNMMEANNQIVEDEESNLEDHEKIFHLSKFHVWFWRLIDSLSIIMKFWLVQSHGILDKFSIVGIIYFFFFMSVIYYFYLCVLLNFMSVDQVSVSQPARLENVDDLLSDRFTQKPFISNQFETADVMRKARPDSDLGRIWKVMQNDSSAFLEFNFRDKFQLLAFVSSAVEMFENGTMALIERYFIKQLKTPLVCHHDFTKQGEKAYYTDKISDGVATSLLNLHMEPENLKYVQYQVTNYIESGIYVFTILEQLFDVGHDFTQTPTVRNIKGLECEAGRRDDDPIFQPGILVAYYQVFLICMFMLSLALVCLIIENIHKWSCDRRKKKIHPMRSESSESSHSRKMISKPIKDMEIEEIENILNETEDCVIANTSSENQNNPPSTSQHENNSESQNREPKDNSHLKIRIQAEIHIEPEISENNPEDERKSPIHPKSAESADKPTIETIDEC